MCLFGTKPSTECSDLRTEALLVTHGLTRHS
jgi:hypothetical protein